MEICSEMIDGRHVFVTTEVPGQTWCFDTDRGYGAYVRKDCEACGYSTIA